MNGVHLLLPLTASMSLHTTFSFGSMLSALKHTNILPLTVSYAPLSFKTDSTHLSTTNLRISIHPTNETCSFCLWTETRSHFAEPKASPHLK